MTSSKAKVLVIHGLAAKPAKWRLHGHVNYCLPSLRSDQIELLYWADLAGYKPRDWANPLHHRKPTGFCRFIRKIRGFLRQATRFSVEHAIAIALGLDPIKVCGGQCIVPTHWLARPLERNARTLFGQHLAEMAQYFCRGSELRHKIANRIYMESLYGRSFDLVIGHSMGSIILIDMLQSGCLGPVKNLVTIGSPLGLGVVRHALAEYYPAFEPLNTRYTGEWLNVSDPLDFVSLDATLDGEYPGCKVRDVYIENDALTPEGNSHPHSLYGYLRSDPVQDILRRSL